PKYLWRMMSRNPNRFLSELGAVGTETAPNPTGKLYIHHAGGAKSGAAGPNDLSELAELVALWPQLAAPVRAALIQLARSSRAARPSTFPPAQRGEAGDGSRAPGSRKHFPPGAGWHLAPAGKPANKD